MGGGGVTLFTPKYNLDSIPCHTEALAEVSKDSESKRDFSLFSKARTKQALAHTCKNDKSLESTKTTDSINSTNQTIQNLESKITHPKPCTHPVLAENLESKAFYESILYFLREYKTHNNNDLKYIILTNTRDFYLIDAREYLIFAKDKIILKAFDNCEKKQGTDTSTQKFYDDIKLYLPTLNATLKFTYFHIQNTPLALLYQALSPQVLLKRKNCIDANTLNQNFYDELLYILGLKEISQNSKVLIQANDIKNTLLDSITKAFQLSPQDDFETIFSLLTTWNNRLLFLRLLESMLLSFKHIDKPFLDIDTLKSFTDLNTLFFEILAIKESKRQSTLKELDSIPYLNSSLFDKTKLEREGKEIKLLDSKTIAIFKHSILKRDKNYKDTQSLPLLEYLFSFLHAYDFTTTPKDIINHTKQNHDKLINAAVLGLVFEKLNGYKEGSFYTPSFITSYMCKESLEKVVIDKFNIAFNANAKTINELPRIARDENKTIQDLHTILFSIKICDPSVGSGHFLVSALNELVFIAYRLGILESLDFQTTLELDNEEIIIKKQGKILEYTKPNDKDEPQHKIQQELFNLKKEIIESCLFGVDINPNSCEITKLRLWIELLKYSFYIFDSNGKNTNTLETLPNIDINIKCGNSLVSRFDLKDSLKHIPNITHQIERYKKLVFDYKNADQNILNISKQEIEAQIESIKQTFTLTLKDPKTKKELEKAIQTHITNYGISLLDNESLLDGLSYAHNIFGNPQLNKEQEDEAYISYGKIVALRKKLDSTTSGEGYKNAFEWRFAFPEVLDSNGDFLGFDLVIGNPPYIRQEEIKHLKPHLQKSFKIYKGTSDIYTYFYEQGYKILKHNGILSFITSNKYCRAGYGEPLREFLLEATALLYYIELNGIKVFDSASVDTSILSFIKTTLDSKHTFDFAHPKDYDTKANVPLQNFITPQSLLQSSLTKESFIFQDSTNAALKAKIEAIGTPLKEWDISINYGIKTGYNEAFIIDSKKRDEILSNCVNENERQRTSELIKPILRGRDIKRYSYEWAGLWIIIAKFNSHQYLEKDYPAIYNYLLQHKDKLQKRGQCTNKPATDKKPYTGQHHWLELDNNPTNEYLSNFEKEKIVWNPVSGEYFFTHIKETMYFNNSLFMMTDSTNNANLQPTHNNKLLYILGLMNSTLYKWLITQMTNDKFSRNRKIRLWC